MSDVISLEKACRLCLDECDDSSLSLEDENCDKIIASIELLTNLKIAKEDFVDPFMMTPTRICDNCITQLTSIDLFREKCYQSDAIIREHINKVLCTEKVVTNYDEEDFYLSEEEEELDEKYEDKLDSLDLDETMNEEEIINEHIEQNERALPRTKNKKFKKDYNIACEICGKTYTKGDMKFHINTHKGLRPYVCEIEDCQKTFPSPYLLKRHKKVTHCTEKPYECDICGKQFKQSNVLKFHKSYHGDPQIPCGVCNKLLRNDRALKKHMMVHTGERPHQCEICKKCFQTTYTLRIHKRVHTNEKPYVCSWCGQAYAYNCLLKAHTEKHHSEEVQT